MTYDYHGAWDNVTGMNAPLYGRSNREDDKGWNVVSNDEKIK
jgi:GH18 family chitinase